MRHTPTSPRSSGVRSCRSMVLLSPAMTRSPVRLQCRREGRSLQVQSVTRHTLVKSAGGEELDRYANRDGVRTERQSETERRYYPAVLFCTGPVRPDVRPSAMIDE